MHVEDQWVLTKDSPLPCPVPGCNDRMIKSGPRPAEPGLPFGIAVCQGGDHPDGVREVTAFWGWGDEWIRL